MSCYYPNTAYITDVLPDGRKEISFAFQHDENRYPKIQLPCGKCIGCKLAKARSWAVRCCHEAQLFENNMFITLTFNEENMPENHSIDKRDLQLFFKKYRKSYKGKQIVINDRGEETRPIRYFACGEYGEQRNRPHYHAIIFNHWFDDAYLWSKSPTGDLLFRSDSLEKLWPYGYSSIGRVTFESAAYVARYQFKKQNKSEGYELVDTETGEIHKQEKEFCIMSRNPGLGKRWFDQYKKDTEKDFIHLGEKRVAVPKYYDYLREKNDDEILEDIKLERDLNMQELIMSGEMHPDRLIQKKHVKESQLKQLKRGFENA
jgi:hypothetical protein